MLHAACGNVVVYCCSWQPSNCCCNQKLCDACWTGLVIRNWRTLPALTARHLPLATRPLATAKWLDSCKPSEQEWEGERGQAHRPRAQLLAYRRIVWTFERFCLLSISRCLPLALSLSLSLSCCFFVGCHALCHASVNATGGGSSWSLLHTPFARPVQQPQFQLRPVLSHPVQFSWRVVPLRRFAADPKRARVAGAGRGQQDMCENQWRGIWLGKTRLRYAFNCDDERRKISFSSTGNNCLRNGLGKRPLPPATVPFA